MLEFKYYVKRIEVSDLNHSGLHYTWNQKPIEGGGIMKKLDRVLVNEAFLPEFNYPHAIFQPYRVSDHSLAVVKIFNDTQYRTKSFKFSNFLVYNEGFQDLVKSKWSTTVDGHKTFTVTRKLRVSKIR